MAIQGKNGSAKDTHPRSKEVAVEWDGKDETAIIIAIDPIKARDRWDSGKGNTIIARGPQSWAHVDVGGESYSLSLCLIKNAPAAVVAPAPAVAGGKVETVDLAAVMAQLAALAGVVETLAQGKGNGNGHARVKS